jgi:type III secretory pathway component EscT
LDNRRESFIVEMSMGCCIGCCNSRPIHDVAGIFERAQSGCVAGLQPSPSIRREFPEM